MQELLYNPKAMIAMSGGVDSSVAAALMVEKGFDCMGVTMKLFRAVEGAERGTHSCCSLDDVEDAKAVARALGIEHYVFNFTDKFSRCVIDKFISCYESGMTPNPCIDCNRYLKFEKLFQRAKELEYDYVVTGHYVRRVFDERSGCYLLKKAVDENKDQSYVLYTMTQQQLRHILFPIGELTKTQVREIAEKNTFINAQKHDSQDICFVPAGNYADFIRAYAKKDYPQGDFVNEEGKLLGRHKGIINYTIGQRRGLGVHSRAALYVCEIDAENNRIVLGSEAALYRKTVIAKDINIIAPYSLDIPMRLKAKARYRQTEQWATVQMIDEDTVKVDFEQPQRALTKGQAVVFYDEDLLVGGGTIVEIN